MIDENNVDFENNITEKLVDEETENLDEVEETELTKQETTTENLEEAKVKNTASMSYSNLDFLGKIKLWTKKHIDYIVTACSIFAMLLICLAVNGDMPFGKNSFLVSDTYEQVAVFFNQFFDFFEGKSSFFYTNYFAKGVEIFSTLEYMYLNSFYLIVFLGGRSNIYVTMTFAVILMLMFNGLVFVWFARKHFKKINNFTRIIFALLYVFSGYFNYSIAFSTWIIYPALILIVVDRFLNFINTGKITSFIISLVWYVVSCYSVGISTMIVLVLIMTLYIFYFFEKEERAKKLTKLLVVLAVSALASLIILFPSVMAILGAGRGSFAGNLLATRDTNIVVKIGVIFLDSIVIILNIFYLIKCNKKSKINKFLLITGIILYLPIFFDSVMKLLCFSTYQCFSSRFYFMNEALIFSIALMVFEQDLLKFKECTTNMLSKLLLGLFLFGLACIVGIIELANFAKIGRNLKTALYAESGLTIIFASVFLLILFILAIGYVLNLRKLFSQNAMKKLVIFFMTFSLFFSYISFISSAGEGRDSRVEELMVTSNVSGHLKLSSNSYEYNNYNIRASELRCSTVFTSLLSDEIMSTYKYFGYIYGKTHVNAKGNTLLADSLLGLNYFLSMKEMDRPYLEFVASIGKYHLYKNTLSTNGTFIIDSAFSFDDTISIYENFENLKQFYGILDDLFVEAEITKTIDDTIDKSNSDEYIKVKIDYTAPADGILYLDREYYSEKTEKGNTLYFAKDNEFYSEIDYLTSGEEYSISIHIKKDKDMEKLKCYFLNYNTAKLLFNKINENQPTFKYNKDGYTIEANLQDNEILYIMVPDINGLHYELNGKEIEVENILNSMVKVSSNEENNTLIVRYKYPHLIKWLIFAIIAIVLIATILVLYRYTEFRHLQKIIEIGMKCLALFIVVSVYLLGIILSFVWFFV